MIINIVCLIAAYKQMKVIKITRRKFIHEFDRNIIKFVVIKAFAGGSSIFLIIKTTIQILCKKIWLKLKEILFFNVDSPKRYQAFMVNIILAI